jgi:hypothetical protein
MQHRVRYQYRPRDSVRPLDYEQTFEIDTDGGPVILPSIGDHAFVQDKSETTDPIKGIVEHRTFHYLRDDGDSESAICLITIIITESDVGLDRLMKD